LYRIIRLRGCDGDSCCVDVLERTTRALSRQRLFTCFVWGVGTTSSLTSIEQITRITSKLSQVPPGNPPRILPQDHAFSLPLRHSFICPFSHRKIIVINRFSPLFLVRSKRPRSLDPCSCLVIHPCASQETTPRTVDFRGQRVL
jgi:hypothetical protein